jgi:FAD:protein FMN transferase
MRIKWWNLIIVVLCNLNAFSQAKRFSFSEPKMGSAFTIILYHEDSLKAQDLAKNAFKIVDSLNASFSDYLPNSEISRLATNSANKNWVEVSPYLYDILKISKEAWIKSEGSFDITIGGLTKLWRQSKKNKKLPNKNILNAALATTGMQFLRLNQNSNSIKLLKKGMSIDLGGIGKGFAAEKVLNYLKSENVFMALCDASGNMAVGDAAPDKPFWQIGIQLPTQNRQLLNSMVQFKNKAISTSGDIYQYSEIENRRYSHILDPKTGLGATFQKQVTIICDNATKADWLSTACYLLSTKKALILAKKEKADILIIESKNNRLKQIKSKNFDSYLK